MSLVGIIANPASGKDIRRLVAYGSTFDNEEKVRIVRRVLMGLAAVGIKDVVFMPDTYGIVRRALDQIELQTVVTPTSFRIEGDQEDSTRAAREMAEKKAGCIVTLGGDGTNRAVAKGSGRVPILPISTGTNNVFPAMIEGTLAGLSAGLIA
jgi:predicted polyphosphate/ATP-dependent NAD kinase